jgi:hypothetical protein
VKRNWLVAAATMGLVAGAGVAACGGSGSGTGGSAGGEGTSTGTTSASSSSVTSGGTTSSTSTTGGTGGATTSTTTSTTSGGADAGVCKPPGTLHPPKLDAGPGTIFCPFSAVDGGKNELCIAGSEHCCESKGGSTMPSSCEPLATACPMGDIDWKCEDPIADCPTGQDCCAPGATLELGGTQNGMACANFASKMTGTTCVLAGTCNGIQMCTSDAECPAGKTCTPFTKSGNQVGGCM